MKKAFHNSDSNNLHEKVVDIKRVSKTVKGGRQLSFSALTVVGDGNGLVGYGLGKSSEVQDAIQKSLDQARNNACKVCLNGTTLQHSITENLGAAKIYMQPAAEGTGIIAGDSMRAVFKAVGVNDVRAKCIGTRNPINVVRATIQGLKNMQNPKYIANKRGKTLKEVVSQKTKHLTRQKESEASVNSFSAYPLLTAPKEANRGDIIDVFVGFRSDADQTLPNAEPIFVKGVTQDDRCQLRYVGKGLEPERNWDSIPFESNCSKLVRCKIFPDAVEAEFKVQYYFRTQLIGAAVRTISLDDNSIETPSNPSLISFDEASAMVDLTVSVTYTQTGQLKWMFCMHGMKNYLSREPVITPIGDAKVFTVNILNSLKQCSYKGVLARNALESFGQLVADKMPRFFFTLLKQATENARQEGRTTPTLLFLTDEAYVPWELAYLNYPPTPENPPFLGAQTIMGRWIERNNIILPPIKECTAKRFTVLAAKYSNNARQAELKAAIEEQDELSKRWRGIPLYAIQENIEELIVQERIPGHFIHFAVHGLSEPISNRQEIILEDNFRVTAEMLGGHYTCYGAEPPRFSFIFLNACQVGVVGTELGEIAGFPGTMVRCGAIGVIAPLWNVLDEDAHKGAVQFYENVFDKNMSVADALRAWRNKYDKGSTTPVAYIFYGHPLLKVSREN